MRRQLRFSPERREEEPQYWLIYPQTPGAKPSGEECSSLETARAKARRVLDRRPDLRHTDVRITWRSGQFIEYGDGTTW